jgi:hypothetical protein
MQQEELARLFSANMSLGQPPPPPYSPVPHRNEQQVYQEQPVYQQEPEKASQPITYISQHYTHTHHVVPIRHIPQEPVKTQVDLSELQAVLLRNQIDPSLLFPSQIDLFQNADDDQRLRLLELWRISPPQGRQGYPEGQDYSTSRQLYDWPPTSLAQEEAMAKLRYEQMQAEKAQQEDIQVQEQQLNASMDQGTESAAVQATRDLMSSNAEPYILSGYEMMANREYEKSMQESAIHVKDSNRYNQATDPAYTNIGGLWEKHVGSTLDMENQYGAYAQARERDCHPIYHDDEMVM